jgi:hypothetical protein
MAAGEWSHTPVIASTSAICPCLSSRAVLTRPASEEDDKREQDGEKEEVKKFRIDQVGGAVIKY